MDGKESVKEIMWKEGLGSVIVLLSLVGSFHRS